MQLASRRADRLEEITDVQARQSLSRATDFTTKICEVTARIPEEPPPGQAERVLGKEYTEEYFLIIDASLMINTDAEL